MIDSQALYSVALHAILFLLWWGCVRYACRNGADMRSTAPRLFHRGLVFLTCNIGAATLSGLLWTAHRPAFTKGPLIEVILKLWYCGMLIYIVSFMLFYGGPTFLALWKSGSGKNALHDAIVHNLQGVKENKRSIVFLLCISGVILALMFIRSS